MVIKTTDKMLTAAAHMVVFQAAYTARRLAPKADTALNPSQPTQRRKVPRLMKETLYTLVERSNAKRKDAGNKRQAAEVRQVMCA